MRRIVVLGVVASLVGMSPQPARADWLYGPIKVMRPDGSVFRITRPEVNGWWRDYREMAEVSKSPRHAAHLLDEVGDALGTPLRGAPRYLILPEIFGPTRWSAARVFYPSSERTPAYVVVPGGVGAARGAPFQWDAWHPATRRMERLVLTSARDPAPPAAQESGLSSPSTEPMPPLWWAIPIAVAAAALLARLTRRSVARRSVGR